MQRPRGGDGIGRTGTEGAGHRRGVRVRVGRVPREGIVQAAWESEARGTGGERQGAYGVGFRELVLGAFFMGAKANLKTWACMGSAQTATARGLGPLRWGGPGQFQPIQSVHSPTALSNGFYPSEMLLT